MPASSAPPRTAPQPPLPGELLDLGRLREFAVGLAQRLAVSGARPPLRTRSAHIRLIDRELEVLAGVYQEVADDVHRGEAVSPSAEWLLDNYHLISVEARSIRRDLPPGYYRRLPRLVDSPDSTRIEALRDLHPSWLRRGVERCGRNMGLSLPRVQILARRSGVGWACHQAAGTGSRWPIEARVDEQGWYVTCVCWRRRGHQHADLALLYRESPLVQPRMDDTHGPYAAVRRMREVPCDLARRRSPPRNDSAGRAASSLRAAKAALTRQLTV